MAASGTGPDIEATAAARYLAFAADPATLRRAAPLVSLPGLAAWISAGLGKPGLPATAGLGLRERTQMYALLAGRGNEDARRDLRRQARHLGRERTRRWAAVALAYIGDEDA